MIPDFKILANGKDITKTINKNTSKIGIKDESGMLSDELTLEVQGSFKKPKYEDELKVWIGTVEDGLFYCGTFKVQTSTQKIGSESSMQITATSADFSKNLKVKRNQSYESVSVRTIVQTIGIRHNLKIVSDFDDVYVLHLEQTNESDMNFLTRIATDYNAVFVIKNDKIIFRKKDKDLLRFELNKDDFTNISIQNTNKTLYNSCKAIWHDSKENKQKSVKIGQEEPTYIIKEHFKNTAEAKLKAQALLEKKNAGTKVGSISSYGFKIHAGGILDLTGTDDDDDEYQIKSVNHTLDSSGWNIDIEIEN